ncbi:MAG: RpiB/LacA/LacB family sugar-phosphate isomerase [Dysgonamonadaceae bacterium]|jgi:ribose 5-phosphate isomerase B|nr:RpiB/LacA/LacB family sugar-phosphate isomerase [Dysgonamonadaceae bacterium]
MTVGLCADHAGFLMKEFIKTLLEGKGIAYRDFGAFGTESSDYPDFAHPLALAVEKGDVHAGIACCGSGNGINITLNKHQGIRSALCWTEEVAALSRRHNDANILALPARFITQNETEKMVNAFLSTTFEGGGRHTRRISKIPVC